jgi:hypothetical protein
MSTIKSEAASVSGAMIAEIADMAAEKDPASEDKKTKPSGPKRTLADLASRGADRREGDDADYEAEFVGPADEDEDADPVRDIGEALAQTMLAGQQFLAVVLESDLTGEEMKAQIEARYGLPGTLLDACAEWAAVASA